MKIVIPTAAEARKRMTGSSQAQKDLNILAKQINKAIMNGEGCLVTDFTNMDPIVLEELRKLGYLLRYGSYHNRWIISWS